jgi:hypothetical protein
MNKAARDHGDAVAQSIPVKRIGVPEDMAGAAIFLASKAGDYVVGDTITVDGGLVHGDLRTSIDAVHAAVALLDDRAGRERWLAALARVIDRSDVHGLLVGRLVRILRDAGRIDPEEAAARLSRALSVGSPAAAKAAWVDGFFSGGGLLLVHDRELLGLLDDWIVDLDEREFVDVLPLLRRTFGQFAGSERRSIGERVRPGRVRDRSAGADLDPERAERAMATVATLLGVGG